MEWDREHDRQAGDEAQEGRIKRLILAAVGQCGVCHRQYTLDDFAVIGHREHLWMVTVVCEGCRNRGVITAVVQGAGPGPDRADTSAAPPRGSRLTDLTPDERARLAAGPAAPVTLDDLLDLHHFLDDFNGDFKALFVKDK